MPPGDARRTQAGQPPAVRRFAALYRCEALSIDLAANGCSQLIWVPNCYVLGPLHVPLSKRSVPNYFPMSTEPTFPRAVLFDMDGVLIDSERIDFEVSKSVARELGFEIDDAVLYQLLGRRTVDVQPDYLARCGCSLNYQEFSARVGKCVRDRVAEGGMPVKAGVERLLDHLDESNIPRAIATGTGRSVALAHLGRLATRFHAIACGDEVKHGKPSPELYLLAAARLQIDPHDCLALEDSLPGIQAAEGAGCVVIMVPDLLPAPPGIKHVCESLDRVTDWLARRV